MWDGGFPHKRSQGSEALMESERRLAYVALTRGKNKVTILEPKEHQGKPVEPSQFTFEACVPLVGAAKGEDKIPSEEGIPNPPEKTGKLNLQTMRLADFLLPVRQEPSPGPLQDFSAPDDLEQQWGPFSEAIAGKGN